MIGLTPQMLFLVESLKFVHHVLSFGYSVIHIILCKTLYKSILKSVRGILYLLFVGREDPSFLLAIIYYLIHHLIISVLYNQHNSRATTLRWSNLELILETEGRKEERNDTKTRALYICSMWVNYGLPVTCLCLLCI